MNDCLFCKLITREITPKFIYESEGVVAFHDIKPRAKTHILVVPKKHIPTFLDIKVDDQVLLSEMLSVLQNFTKEKVSGKIGYKVVVNGGQYQEVPHLHWHFLADS